MLIISNEQLVALELLGKERLANKILFIIQALPRARRSMSKWP
jgi:hypothetical protein